jgi:hypothetical protein
VIDRLRDALADRYRIQRALGQGGRPDGTFVLVRPVREVRTVVIRGFRTEMRNQLAKQGGK